MEGMVDRVKDADPARVGFGLAYTRRVVTREDDSDPYVRTVDPAVGVIACVNSNELIIKEKGLLFVKQPPQNFGESTGVARSGFEPETSGL